MAGLTLTKMELEELTGYKEAPRQLEVLHRRGFLRAFISRRGLVLERAHYDAICRGAQHGGADVPRKVANLSMFKRTA